MNQVIITEPNQGSDAWKQEKMGYVSAGSVSDVLATGRGSAESKVRESYKWEIVTQRLTGIRTDGFVSDAMTWGIETEPLARIQYEVKYNTFVEQAGFIKHPNFEWLGASPDGLVGSDGLVEIKCPNTKTHLQTLINDKVPTQYIPQMQCQMEVIGRDWCDFISYDPRLNEPLKFFCKRVVRDDEYISSMKIEVAKFLEEVELLIIKLKG